MVAGDFVDLCAISPSFQQRRNQSAVRLALYPVVENASLDAKCATIDGDVHMAPFSLPTLVLTCLGSMAALSHKYDTVASSPLCNALSISLSSTWSIVLHRYPT